MKYQSVVLKTYRNQNAVAVVSFNNRCTKFPYRGKQNVAQKTILTQESKI